MNQLTYLIGVLTITAKTVNCDNEGWLDYLVDNTEEFHDIPLVWEEGSKVPSWLGGTYVRNGPGQHSFGSERRQMNNWLDGFPKLHSFKFNGDRVLFSGKMIESKNYLNSLEVGELTPQFTLNNFVNPEDDWNMWEKMEIFYKMMDGTAFDNFNPMIWRFGEKNVENGLFMAVTDAPAAMQFNISDLSTMGVHIAKRYPVATTGCAHPLREPGTDNSINFMTKNYFITGEPFIELQRYKPEDTFEEPEVIAAFTPEKTSLVHSFSVTEDYVVLFMYPLDIDITKMFTNNFHLMETLVWDETEETDIYVIGLKDGEVQHLTTQSVYSLHHANAYQINKDELVVDICEHEHNGLRDYLKVENLLQPPKETKWEQDEANIFARYKINLETSKVSRSTFANKVESPFINTFDFPMINEAHRGKEYCYVYGTSLLDYSRTAIVKKDVCSSDSDGDKVWYKENNYMSEIWFFPTPDATQEDDGVLMTIAFDGELKRSYLMLLDAVSLEPVAKSYLPKNIPWSAHGYHFPEAQF